MRRIWFDEALTADGWARGVMVSVDGGRIAAVAAASDPAGADERHDVGLPGLANVHSHAFQRAMAGLTERRGAGDDSFWTWRTLMYRFAGKMTPDDVEAVAGLAYAEMLEGGFTRVGEFHYLHHDPDGRPYGDIAEMSARIAAASAEAGIGLTLLPVFYAHGDFGGAPASPGQRRFLNDPERYGRLVAAARQAVRGLDGAVVGIAPHSLRAATADEIAALLPLADGGPVHIHIAEQTREVDDCLAASGRRAVDYLLDELPVDRRWCLIHATHVSPGEARRIAAAGAVAGLCPVTEANLGDGIFPAEGYLAAGGGFAVGSDSNVEISAPAELRMLEYSQRLHRRIRNAVAGAERSTGRTLFAGALAGGAQALGVAAGGIAPGAAADLVSLDRRKAAAGALSGDAIVDGWIFGGRAMTDCVWRAGVKRVEGGRHVDRTAIVARFEAAMGRMTA